MSAAPDQKTPFVNRRTVTRTFRIYKDQLEFIESINSDCASMFIRFLIDAWVGNKIPKSVMDEFFAARKDIRKRADHSIQINLERLKQLVRDNPDLNDSDLNDSENANEI